MTTIFDYTDYRLFLKDRYAALKQINPAFSYRYFSQKAGFSSPNFLKLVMDGARNLSAESIHKFGQVLKLNNKEQRFFELMVQYNQASDPKQRQHYFELLLDFPDYRKTHHLEKEQYTYLSYWYYPAILELTALSDFREDPQWISDQLQKKVSLKEVKEALEVLLNLGLLQRDAEGKIGTVHTALTTGEEAKNLAAYTFHEQVLTLAKEAVSQQSAEEREFAAMTLAVNEQQLIQIKEKIRDLRKWILNFLGQGGDKPTAVYQMGTQLFRLTAKRKETP